MNILLIGYGNTARGDDGLGPALVRALAARRLPGVTVRCAHQLAVEDCADLGGYDIVVFCDASIRGAEPYFFRATAQPRAAEPGVSSHHVDPDPVAALARTLYGSASRCFVLGVRGYAFDDYGEQLSPQAQSNLAQAERFLRRALETGAWGAATP